ncbi:hypothetical protein Val02_13780 [Virgisporangium aliadipatigenens]|uniref:Uncharacterized protein n=1 Tax=Virgisporangium aliadipatigenens TaxID=741659 RepID=A0A8J3YHF4_9ACTN|nr:hypothetical protein [Virgisporangium aliadipatigenens]GIJ44492.1 hypothetical protein Val02_13780 [Virgisporangium aliadipatigenens]
MSQYREINYTDELLADGSVHRRFSDGREEWRRRGPDRLVHWRDNQGQQGTDELLGNRIVKRFYAGGQAVYGRDIGYGRTVWGNGTLTRNRTTFGGRMGAILAAVGAGAVLGAIVAPPMFMSPEEEEDLREQARQQVQQQAQSGGDSDSDWDFDGDDSGDSDDFG